MSTRRLPPLNALRAFDVATRHMSFKHAADELCITSAAVSHRIRALEEWLGVKLFNRLTRSLELTKEGEAYAPMIRQAFILLMDASDTLKQSNDGGDLLISTTMSFASNWLASRLPRFYERHEAFNLRIEGSDLPTDFVRSNIDVAIRYGEGGYDDLYSQMLFTDLVTPVCTAAVAEGLCTPADLSSQPRLDYQWSGFNDRDPSWEKWFKAAGVADARLDPVPIFSDEHMVLAQAKAGRGVALLGIVAAADAIQQGDLVRPFPVALENRSYYFVCQTHAAHLDKIAAFQEWITAEAKCFDYLVEHSADLQFDHVQRSEDL